ncbi:MAG: CvpA family protein [Chloroflexi bacterium]|nr:CvpA family protein [Chloroflexota bacterium]
MEIIKGFFSFLFNVVGIVSSILGIWSVIRTPEEVKETLTSWGKYFRSLIKTKQPKQPGKSQPTGTLSEGDLSAIFENAFDSSRGAVLKSEGTKQPNKRGMAYPYILATSIVLLIILVGILSKPVSAPEPEIVSPPIEWTLSGGMNIVSLFWMYVCFFGVIGAMRGWAKEILVIFSGILALAVNVLLFKYFPFLKDLPDNSISLFWVRSLILMILVYFGYQTVVSVPRLASKAVRERLVDGLYGTVMGGVNGYLVAGSFLAYFHMADYPYQDIIAPATDTHFSEIVTSMMASMPPNLLGEPGIYFAVIILLIFVLVVYG